MDGRARPGRKEGGGEVREWVGRNLHCTECHQFRKRISRWTVKPDPQLNHTISCITRTMQGRTRTRESSVLVSARSSRLQGGQQEGKDLRSGYLRAKWSGGWRRRRACCRARRGSGAGRRTRTRRDSRRVRRARCEWGPESERERCLAEGDCGGVGRRPLSVGCAGGKSRKAERRARTGCGR